MTIRFHPRALFWTILLLLSRASAFHVTPWSRIRHASTHLEKSQTLRETSNRFQQLHATTPGTSERTVLQDMMKLEREVVRLGRRGKTNEALELYGNVKRPSIRLMNGAIDACARARPTRLDQAFSILEEGMTQLHLEPNVFTFGALMSACARARRADKALDLLQSMQDEFGVTPNAVVYSTAISACARADPPQPQQALDLLQQAPPEMSVVGYNAALSACAMAGQWEPAMNLLRRMEDINKTDAVSYGTVLAACERSQQWRVLLKQAKEMQQCNITLDSMAVTSVLHACQQLGLAQEALDYLQLMKSSIPSARKTAGFQRKGVRRPLRGADAVAYRLAISACARGGKWQEGIRLLEELRNETALDVVAYTAAITGCEYAGEWKMALSLVDSMRKDNVEPNVVTFAAVLGACAKSISNAQRNGKPTQQLVDAPKKKALHLLRVMKKDPTVVNPNVVAYNAAIRVCAEAMDLDRALELLEELEEDGLKPTVVTFGSLMTACERVGNVDGASKVFRRMKEYDIVPNEIIYGAAISCCRKAGETDRVLLLLRKMIRDRLAPNVATFNTVLVAQTEGRTIDCMDRAILVYKLMKTKYAPPNAHPNRQTYNLLIRALAAKQKPLEAETFLRKMRADGYIPDVDLYTATVTAYERTGQPLKALRLMESMSEDGYDFYEIKVLNAAFKKAVRMANAVGRGLKKDATAEESIVNENEDGKVSFQLDIQDGEDEGFINGTSTGTGRK